MLIIDAQFVLFFFFKQKTAYEMRISDWSSDVCSSDLFMARSHNEKRYGVLPADMTVQDWGVSYDQLEPYYDRFEYLCGIGGKAGNLGGKTQAGGNPFEGARRRD